MVHLRPFNSGPFVEHCGRNSQYWRVFSHCAGPRTHGSFRWCMEIPIPRGALTRHLPRRIHARMSHSLIPHSRRIAFRFCSSCITALATPSPPVYACRTLYISQMHGRILQRTADNDILPWWYVSYNSDHFSFQCRIVCTDSP